MGSFKCNYRSSFRELKECNFIADSMPWSKPSILIGM